MRNHIPAIMCCAVAFSTFFFSLSTCCKIFNHVRQKIYECNKRDPSDNFLCFTIDFKMRLCLLINSVLAEGIIFNIIRFVLTVAGIKSGSKCDFSKTVPQELTTVQQFTIQENKWIWDFVTVKLHIFTLHKAYKKLMSVSDISKHFHYNIFKYETCGNSLNAFLQRTSQRQDFIKNFKQYGGTTSRLF